MNEVNGKKCRNNIEVLWSLIESNNRSFYEFINYEAFCDECGCELKLLNPFDDDHSTWEIFFGVCVSKSDCRACYMGDNIKSFNFSYTGIYIC